MPAVPDALQESALDFVRSDEILERYRLLFELSRDAVYRSDAAGRLLDVNPAMLALFGYERGELLPLGMDALFVSAAERDRLLDAIEADGDVRDREVRLRRKDGVELMCLVSAAAARSETGELLGYQGIVHDVTERKRAEESLRHAALHDPLTQLPNRTYFVDRLRRLMARLRWRPQYRFAVLFVDIDRFKLVNDSLGHRAGDELLIAIAERLTATVRPEDIVARLGGDEFAILLLDLPSVQEADRIAARVQEALRRPFDLRGQELYATASLGIALSTSGYASPEEVLRDADTAMYAAKGRGRDQHVVFNTAMHARAVELLETETALRRALERDEFVLHYQPIVALDSRRVMGFEALVRWRHPERGLLSPGEFLAVAEETGLIVPIGGWVLREACRAVRSWREEFNAVDWAPIVNVNVSGKQLIVPDFAEQVRRVLEEEGVPGEALRFEITESVLVDNAESVLQTLHTVKALGIRLCLDDFGTGYSSLSYLKDFPVDILKIDRSFISRLGGMSASGSTEMVGTILSLARQLQLGSVAEGVETLLQADDLVQLGCIHAQGFLFSRPVEAEAAREMLRGGAEEG